MASYFGDSMVVTCMRAGLYQTKNGLLVFFGSLRSRKSMTLAEISSSTVFDRSSVSGPSSLHVWFFAVPSEDLHAEHRARRRQADRRLRIHRAGDLGDAGDRRVLARRRDALLGRGLVDVGEAHPLHRVEVIEIAPVLLEAVRRRQGRRCGRPGGSCRTRRCCSRDRAGTWRSPACRAADRTGCRAAAAGSCPCAADTCR